MSGKISLLMAPMVDLSHVAFRELVRSFGGCDMFYSEMLNSRIVPQEPAQKSVYLKWSRTDDLVFQIVGNDPPKMAESALRLSLFRPRGIDINMGCWLNKITCHGWGAALMKDMAKARDVTEAVRSAVDIPLSVKMRLGYVIDREYLVDFGKMLESVGVDFIVLHPRTAEEGLKKRARWEYIAYLKDALNIPVMGNGDVTSVQDALFMIKQTGCDGIMIGRQALREPWIFRDIKCFLDYKEIPEKPDAKKAIMKLAKLLGKYFPEDIALKRFKKSIYWLASSFKFNHFIVKELSRAKSLEEAELLIDKIVPPAPG